MCPGSPWGVCLILCDPGKQQHRPRAAKSRDGSAHHVRHEVASIERCCERKHPSECPLLGPTSNGRRWQRRGPRAREESRRSGEPSPYPGEGQVGRMTNRNSLRGAVTLTHRMMADQDGDMGHGRGYVIALCADTRPRRIGSILPDCTRWMRNVETLLGSAWDTGAVLAGSRPTARKEQHPRRRRCPKKRRPAAERRRECITGWIEPRERRDSPRKGADVGQGTKRLMVVTTGQRRQKLDTAFRGCKQTRRERQLSPASRSHESLGLGAVSSGMGTHGSEAGNVP